MGQSICLYGVVSDRAEEIVDETMGGFFRVLLNFQLGTMLIITISLALVLQYS
jgi:hypothetical protein